MVIQFCSNSRELRTFLKNSYDALKPGGKVYHAAISITGDAQKEKFGVIIEPVNTSSTV